MNVDFLKCHTTAYVDHPHLTNRTNNPLSPLSRKTRTLQTAQTWAVGQTLNQKWCLMGVFALPLKQCIEAGKK